MVNPHEGKVVAIVLDDGKWYLGAKLVPFDAINGLGENAVTIEHDNKVLALSAVPEYGKLLEADVKVIDSNVLTKSGKFQGTVTEIVFDAAGKIVNCSIKTAANEETILPAENILTFGKQVLITADIDVVSQPPERLLLIRALLQLVSSLQTVLHGKTARMGKKNLMKKTVNM